MLSLLALVILVATLTTIFYMQLSLTVGSVTFAVVWLLCGLLASWLYNPILLILLAGALVPALTQADTSDGWRHVWLSFAAGGADIRHHRFAAFKIAPGDHYLRAMCRKRFGCPGADARG